jgi:RNA polymerase-interacting CarD/CdnL/TRCF family regulator
MENNNGKFIRGDLVIECGVAYKIIKMKRKNNYHGKSEKHMIYKPLFITKRNQGMICSIPVSSIEKTTIRLPLSKNKIYRILRAIDVDHKNKSPVTPKEIDEALKSNDFENISLVVERLVIENNQLEKNLPQSKKNALDQGIDHLSQEIAAVLNISLDEAKGKITSKISN